MMQLATRTFTASIFLAGALYGGIAQAAAIIAPQSHLVSLSTAPAAREQTFTIATAQDLVVTLTDLNTPKALSSASVVVTQGDVITGSATFSAPASQATVEMPAAQGEYVMRVFGAPDPAFSVGTFTACVAPKSDPANCIQTASFSDNIVARGSANDPTLSTLSRTLTVTTAGLYTFIAADLNFPVALNSPPNLALFQGSTPVAGGLGIVSGSSLSLNPGTYTLLVLAQADQTVKSGLYGVTIAGPSVLLDEAIPVGSVEPSIAISNDAAQSLTLKVTDYGFPTAVNSASALVTSGGIALGTANASSGATPVAAPAGNLKLWTYASAGADAGTYGVDLSAGGTLLYADARAVNPAGAVSMAFAFMTPTVDAGSYDASAVDLQFPSSLTGLSFAVAQNGSILSQSSTEGTLQVTTVQGPAVILVSAQTPSAGSTTGNGLFDVSLRSTGATANLIVDRTQSVGGSPALFDSQSLTLGSNGSFDVTLTDLKFPAQFGNLALVVSRGSEVVGKIFGGGTFTFAGAPGQYQVTFIATPAADQQYGLYAIKGVESPPLVSLASNASTAVSGDSIKLTWSAAGGDTCSASGGNWTGSKAVAQTEEVVVLDATTTFTLTCTGVGGTSSKSVTVTATPKPASAGKGGGGSMDWFLLALLTIGVLFKGRGRRLSLPG